MSQMRSKPGRALMVAAAMVSGLGASALAAPSSGVPLPPALGALAATPLTRPDGRAVRLGDYAVPGKVTLISFWASWCVPCVAETRHLVALRRRIAPQDLNIVAINLDTNRRQADLDRFLSQSGGSALTQLWGDRQGYRAVTGSAVLSLPRLYLFDRRQQPVAAFGSYGEGHTDQAIEAAVTRALAAR